MINQTSLKHPTIIKKVFAATKNVVQNNWSVDHVTNAKGVVILAIRVHDGKAILTDRYGRNLTKQFAANL